AGSTMTDGNLTPGAHDGMTALPGTNGRVVLLRNHELSGTDGALSPQNAYDPLAQGGVTYLEFDPGTEKLVSSRLALVGTIENCNGGRPPPTTHRSSAENVRAAAAAGR